MEQRGLVYNPFGCNPRPRQTPRSVVVRGATQGKVSAKGMSYARGVAPTRERASVKMHTFRAVIRRADRGAKGRGDAELPLCLGDLATGEVGFISFFLVA